MRDFEAFQDWRKPLPLRLHISPAYCRVYSDRSEPDQVDLMKPEAAQRHKEDVELFAREFQGPRFMRKRPAQHWEFPDDRTTWTGTERVILIGSCASITDSPTHRTGRGTIIAVLHPMGTLLADDDESLHCALVALGQDIPGVSTALVKALIKAADHEGIRPAAFLRRVVARAGSKHQ